MPKIIYTSAENHELFDRLQKKLDEQKLSFSGWVVEQARAYMDADQEKTAAENEAGAPIRLCMASNVSGQPCTVSICRQLANLHGYGLAAREREFAKYKEHCIFSSYPSPSASP